ncbi:hypothetical protein AVEN_136150-1 [Araneus ventricosus]|uniref:RNase H type-1 domain-containing protein n=1 Tax=Araneus ventricosus TaxID=182803 RepID=A0A4Y2DCZ6_ARAVE|nr:hypothetical protein AVEN_46743-1 [Araneus ventricosus]GBM13984.1 hypothetical protein AVEN_85669-1 [Araneus ventricosus]GBM13997.1 hypothetical protein AVEN_117044-1 [Araneus ventricosus]GBM14009.1 hypothetical protein AVEN_136150-1 [Araneus ventricosus]
MALKSAHSRSKFVNSVKQDLFRAKGLVGLSWVKAHVGIPGNEWADQQAKRAITTGLYLNVGPACLTRIVRNRVPGHSAEFWAAVSTSLSEQNLVPNKCSEARLGAKSGLYGGGSKLAN